MADVVIASDDLVVLGGPASINVELDIGAAGQRGSQIFTDVGKPTSPGISFPVPPQINDLYINLNPSDTDYLFLYQYKLDNAVLGWTKLLRLIPTTILFNPVFKFINGEAHTSVNVAGVGTVDVLGIYFPITGTLENENIENIDPRDLNVQYTVIGSNPAIGAVELKEINTTFTVEFFNPITQQYQQIVQNFGARYLYARFKIAELDAQLDPQLVNGYRKVDMVLTIAGRSDQVIDITGVVVANPLIQSPGYLTIPNHGLSLGSRFGYLANGNTSIVGLTDQADYYVAMVVDEDNVILTTNPLDAENNLVVFTNATFTGIHSIVKAGGLL